MTIRTADTLLTTNEAAEQLGVSTRRIRAMASQGMLDYDKVSHRLLIVSSSVRKLRRQNRSSGRVFSQRIALASLYLISGKTPDWISSSEKSRLRKRLSNMDAEELLSLCRNRSTVIDYWCRDTRLEQLSQRIRPSSATGELATQFGLTRTDDVEGYTIEQSTESLIQDMKLRTDFRPTNVRLHICKFLPKSESPMPLGVCAADLADSLNVREHGAGMETLSRLLEEFREDFRALAESRRTDENN